MPRDRVDPIDKHVGNRVRMRRLMLDVSLSELADALGLTFQQVAKYEKGINRIGASRLQRISSILQAPIPFFFEGAPRAPTFDEEVRAVSPQFINDFLATTDGLNLVKAFSRIQNRKLRSAIVLLVKQIGRIKRGSTSGTPLSDLDSAQ